MSFGGNEWELLSIIMTFMSYRNVHLECSAYYSKVHLNNIFKLLMRSMGFIWLRGSLQSSGCSLELVSFGGFELESPFWVQDSKHYITWNGWSG